MNMTSIRITRSSDPGGNLEEPYIQSAEVVTREDYDYPSRVQYVNVATVEELIKLMELHGSIIVRQAYKNHIYGDDIEFVPILEIYDSCRE